MAQSTLDKDHFLFLTIRLGRRIAHLLRQRMDETEQHLIGPHIGILADLKYQDGVKQQDLAVSSLRDKATITRAIQSLTEEGLVRRTGDPADKRSKLIYLTPKGREVQERAQQHGHDLLAEATQDIDTQALANCLSVLNKMYENLK